MNWDHSDHSTVQTKKYFCNIPIEEKKKDSFHSNLPKIKTKENMIVFLEVYLNHLYH